MGTSTTFRAKQEFSTDKRVRNWRNSDRTLHRLWYAKGKVLAKQGYFDAALASFNAALRFCPNHAKSWVYRGVVLAHLKQPKAALASFDRALALEADSRETWIFRGAILTALGDRPGALRSYNRALALHQNQQQVCNEYPLWCSINANATPIASA